MTASLHGFAFQTGNWRVRHRKLAHRLVGSSEWLEFGGKCRAYELLGGAGNVDDFFIDDPNGAYRAATFRRLDATTGEWSIFWADARRDGLDPPMRGRFHDEVGIFFGAMSLTAETSAFVSSGLRSVLCKRGGSKPSLSMARLGR